MSEWPQDPSNDRNPSSEAAGSDSDSTALPVTDEPRVVASGAETNPESIDVATADEPESEVTAGPAAAEVGSAELRDEVIPPAERDESDPGASLPAMTDLDQLAAELDAIDATLARLDQDRAVSRQDRP